MKKFLKNIGTVNLIVLAVIAALYAFGIAGPADASTVLFGVGLPILFGTVAATPGSPDHTYATGSGQIPVLFADKTVEVFYDVSVAPFVSNSDYEGGH